MKVKKLAFNKTNAKKLVATIKKDLKANLTFDDEIIKNFCKYLVSKKIECIITNKEKIIFACGTRVRKYLNFNISNSLKKIVDDDHLSDLSSVFLEIINHKRIRGLYQYKAIKSRRGCNGKNIGCIIYLYKHDNLYNMLKLKDEFEF